MAPLTPLLSIDPSSTKIGWALLHAGPAYVASGVQLIPKVTPEERVPYVGDAVAHLIQHCRPASVLIEIPDFIAGWAKGHIVWFFRAVGATELVVHQHGLPTYRVPASINKDKQRKTKGITLYRQVTGRPPIEDDESDALLNGWTFLGSNPAPPAAPPMPVVGHQTHGDDQDDYEWDECIDEGPDGF